MSLVVWKHILVFYFPGCSGTGFVGRVEQCTGCTATNTTAVHTCTGCEDGYAKLADNSACVSKYDVFKKNVAALSVCVLLLLWRYRIFLSRLRSVRACLGMLIISVF